MSDFLIVSALILLVDVINVVVFAAVIMSLSGPKPLVRSSALIFGHTVVYFVVGIMVIYGVAEVLAPVIDLFVDGIVNPTPINFAMGLVLGLLLIAVAIKMIVGGSSEGQAKDLKTKEVGGVVSFFILGATIRFVGLPFAIPYYAFIKELFRFEIANKPLAILVYNLIYALPYLLLALAFALWGTRIIDRLKAINVLLNNTMSWLVPTLFLLLGMALVVDAVKFFLDGSGLV